MANVLIVEKDAALSRRYHDELKKRGFAAIHAKDGDEGLYLSAKLNGSVCVVVVDMDLPDMKTVEFLEILRKRGYEMPIVVTTESDHVSGLEGYDIFSFVPKPIPVNQLVDIVSICHRLFIEINECTPEPYYPDKKLSDEPAAV